MAETKKTRQEKILTLIENDDKITKAEIAEVLNVSENNRAIETLGNYMKAKGNTNGLNQILEYLQPSYEKGQPVYDDIIRIKMKFE